ncbi:MAG: shikimate dehydrogenase family protein [Acidobacteriaceae bacterium]
MLGRSLPYSLSPEVHRAIFPIIQSKWKAFDSIDYAKIELPDQEEFCDFVRNGEERGFSGFNVTFPYKYVASTMEGQVSKMVLGIHSANTIACGPPLQIISTDGNGFRFAMEKSLSELSYAEYCLVILGAGGAARAVLRALRPLGWKRIILTARSLDRAENATRDEAEIELSTLDNFRRDARPHFIVQATPVGQRAAETLLEHFEWKADDVAADLVYNPLRTKFLHRAAGFGAKTLDGLGMLIEQAALSQYFWTTGAEAESSELSSNEFHLLHTSLAKLLLPQWDASAI